MSESNFELFATIILALSIISGTAGLIFGTKVIIDLLKPKRKK